MVLFIPGYVLISALFPKKNDLDATERVALSFGLSIAVVPLIGLGLNYTPFGIRLIPIFIAEYRREKLSVEEQFSVSFQVWKNVIHEIKKPRSRIDNILTIILIFSMILAIGMLIYVITVPKTGEKFTEFYILNSATNKADNYNTNLNIDRPGKYLIGVINHEYSSVNYTIEVMLAEDILSSKNLTLENDQIWEYKKEMI